jgi:hypothetical protein
MTQHDLPRHKCKRKGHQVAFQWVIGIQTMTARHGQVQFESNVAHEQEGTDKELGAREAAYAALLVKLKVCSGPSNLLLDFNMPSDLLSSQRRLANGCEYPRLIRL